jgi:esterase/lipase superfamily enzyme
MMLTRRTAIAALLATTACAPRAMVSIVPPAAGAIRRDVYVGTTRVSDAAGVPTGDRSETLEFSRISVSIPPEHVAGKIELPRRGETTSAARHFAASGTLAFGGATDFRSTIASELRLSPRGRREVAVYVHGFNNTFADGVFRVAQISNDLDLPGLAAHYSWPSAAQPLNYAYDRDSVLHARDGLERLLSEIRSAGADHVTLIAHSMGSLLAMETLRQIEIGSPGRVRQLVQAVVLFSPDLDVDVFRAQARRIGQLPDPFIIFTSRRDRALGLSARLTGQRARLGNLEDFSRLSDLRVIVLDVSAFSNTAGLNHFSVARSPTLIRLLGNVPAVDEALGADRSGRAGLFPGTILTLQNATAIVLSPVAGILD